MTNAPYRSAAPALADLVAGQVQAKLDSHTQLEAVLSPTCMLNTDRGHQHQGASSNIPTCPRHDRAECRPSRAIYGWAFVARPPRPTRWSPGWQTAIQRFVAQPATQARFDKDGIEPVGNGSDEFRAQIASEIAQWRELSKTTKITVD